MRLDAALDRAFSLDPVHERMLEVALLRDGRAGERWRAMRREIDLDHFWDGKALDFLPLVHRALVDEAADDPDLARLRGVQRRTWVANQLRFRSLATALEVLRAVDVETLVLKGSAWALTVYSDVGLRPMHDCDVLVHPRQAALAVSALADAGWRPAGALSSRFALRHQEVDVRDPEDRVLDLHWHLAFWLVGPGEEWTADEPFWARSVALDMAGSPTRALDPTDALLHAVLHGAWAGWRSAPQWVPDAVLIVGDGDAIEWGRIVEIARRRNLTVPVRRALDYLRGGFAVPVPPEVVSALDVPTSARSRRCYARVGLGGGTTPAERRWLGPVAESYRFWTTQSAPLDRRTAFRVFPGWLADHWGLDSPWRLPAATVRKAVARARAGPGGAPGRDAVSTRPAP